MELSGKSQQIKQGIVKQVLTIAATLLVALTMISADLAILARYSISERADFTLISQYLQIAVILATTLNIGVNIHFNFHKTKPCIVSNILGYAAFIRVLLLLISLLFLLVLDLSTTRAAMFVILTLGLLLLSLYMACCSLLECPLPHY